MRMRKQFVRNKSIPCLSSVFLDKKYRLSNDISRLLKDNCGESLDYLTLLKIYKESKKGYKNKYFIEVLKINKNYSITISNSNIMLFFFQGKSSVEKNIPWRYPDFITNIGKSSDTIKFVANEWIKLSFIDFFLKYNIYSNSFFSKEKHIVRRIDSGKQIDKSIFNIDNLLNIEIDDHIKFIILPSYYTTGSYFFSSFDDVNTRIIDQNNYESQKSNIYIADSWGTDPDEVINDILSISSYEFGRKYHSVWGH